jgi:hypothetical protein
MKNRTEQKCNSPSANLLDQVGQSQNRVASREKDKLHTAHGTLAFLFYPLQMSGFVSMEICQVEALLPCSRLFLESPKFTELAPSLPVTGNLTVCLCLITPLAPSGWLSFGN